MEKKILIASNVCTDKYDNTLSNFKNVLPKGHLPVHKQWKIGVESIGIHCQFLNEAVSKNNKYPALIMFSRGYLISQIGFDCFQSDDEYFPTSSDDYIIYNPEIKSSNQSSNSKLTMNIFHPAQCYFINQDKTYNLKELNEHFNQITLMYNDVQNNSITSFNKYPANFIGFPTRYDEAKGWLEFGQFGYSYKDEKLRAYMLLHKTFFDHMNTVAPSKKIYDEFHSKHEVIIEGQTYYWILFAIDNESNQDGKGVPRFIAKEIRAQISIPKIIKIKCSNVKGIMKNGSFCKELAYIPISKSDFGKYIFKNFQILDNFELEELKPEYLQIELLDESDCPLRLQAGHPTIVKAHLTSSKMNTTNFRVSSHSNELFPGNKSNKFTVKLPNKIILFGEEPKLSLSSILIWNWPNYSSDYDFFHRVIDSKGSHKKFWVQNPVKDIDDLVRQIKSILKEWVKIEMLESQHILIEAKENHTLTLAKDLAYLFGLSDTVPNGYAILSLSQSQKHVSQYPRHHIPIFPDFMFMYCSAIKPSLVSDGFHKLLKVIPISNLKSEAYKSIEFEHEEFIPLATSELQYIEFELRSHTGSLIEFTNELETYLSLSLKDE